MLPPRPELEEQENEFFWDLDWEEDLQDAPLRNLSPLEGGLVTEQTCQCGREYGGTDCSWQAGKL